MPAGDEVGGLMIDVDGAAGQVLHRPSNHSVRPERASRGSVAAVYPSLAVASATFSLSDAGTEFVSNLLVDVTAVVEMLDEGRSADIEELGNCLYTCGCVDRAVGDGDRRIQQFGRHEEPCCKRVRALLDCLGAHGPLAIATRAPRERSCSRWHSS